jgi:hypothetical protein
LEPETLFAQELTMSVTLPPSPRDFEIHRLRLVHHMSTWRLAEKYEVSQTRIRQIVKRVTEWLAETLPVKTEAELEKETRLAQHIAADQFQHQLELLQNYFDGSGGDPKYSRQQTRVILALARLGTIPGSIEALAADTEESSRHTPCAITPHKPEASARDSIRERTDAATNAPPNPQSEICNPKSEIPSPPPLGDFSPSTGSNATEALAPENDLATTPLYDGPSPKISFPYEDALAGLCVMEKRLLTLIDNTTHDDQEHRKGLEQTLANIRHQKATLELRLSPNHPGAATTTHHSPTHHSPSFNPQPQAQAPAQLET